MASRQVRASKRTRSVPRSLQSATSPPPKGSKRAANQVAPPIVVTVGQAGVAAASAPPVATSPVLSTSATAMPVNSVFQNLFSYPQMTTVGTLTSGGPMPRLASPVPAAPTQGAGTMVSLGALSPAKRARVHDFVQSLSIPDVISSGGAGVPTQGPAGLLPGFGLGPTSVAGGTAAAVPPGPYQWLSLIHI